MVTQKLNATSSINSRARGSHYNSALSKSYVKELPKGVFAVKDTTKGIVLAYKIPSSMLKNGNVDLSLEVELGTIGDFRGSTKEGFGYLDAMPFDELQLNLFDDPSRRHSRQKYSLLFNPYDTTDRDLVRRLHKEGCFFEFFNDKNSLMAVHHLHQFNGHTLSERESTQYPHVSQLINSTLLYMRMLHHTTIVYYYREHASVLQRYSHFLYHTTYYASLTSDFNEYSDVYANLKCMEIYDCIIWYKSTCQNAFDSIRHHYNHLHDTEPLSAHPVILFASEVLSCISTSAYNNNPFSMCCHMSEIIDLYMNSERRKAILYDYLTYIHKLVYKTSDNIDISPVDNAASSISKHMTRCIFHIIYTKLCARDFKGRMFSLKKTPLTKLYPFGDLERTLSYNEKLVEHIQNIHLLYDMPISINPKEKIQVLPFGKLHDTEAQYDYWKDSIVDAITKGTRDILSESLFQSDFPKIEKLIFYEENSDCCLVKVIGTNNRISFLRIDKVKCDLWWTIEEFLPEETVRSIKNYIAHIYKNFRTPTVIEKATKQQRNCEDPPFQGNTDDSNPDEMRTKYIPGQIYQYTEDGDQTTNKRHTRYHQKAEHVVVGHKRKVKGEPAERQVELAKANNFILTPGFTYVIRHSRGKGKKNVVYKERRRHSDKTNQHAHVTRSRKLD
jgi:hypothetical protein